MIYSIYDCSNLHYKEFTKFTGNKKIDRDDFYFAFNYEYNFECNRLKSQRGRLTPKRQEQAEKDVYNRLCNWYKNAKEMLERHHGIIHDRCYTGLSAEAMYNLVANYRQPVVFCTILWLNHNQEETKPDLSEEVLYSLCGEDVISVCEGRYNIDFDNLPQEQQIALIAIGKEGFEDGINWDETCNYALEDYINTNNLDKSES